MPIMRDLSCPWQMHQSLCQSMQSADTFINYYRAAVNVSNDNICTEYALPAFDAVYVAALAMNASVERLRELGLELEGFQFEDVNRSAMYVDILREEAGKVEFRGVSVREQ